MEIVLKRISWVVFGVGYFRNHAFGRKDNFISNKNSVKYNIVLAVDKINVVDSYIFCSFYRNVSFALAFFYLCAVTSSGIWWQRVSQRQFFSLDSGKIFRTFRRNEEFCYQIQEK